MTDKKIDLPEEFKAREGARRAVRGFAGMLPVVGSLAAEAFDGLAPDENAIEQKRWQGDVTDGVNHLGTRVDEIDERTGERKETISGLPAQLLGHMVQACPNGLLQSFTPVADLAAEFPDESEQAVKDAMADLESYGMVERLKALGDPGRFRLTEGAYEQVDRQLMGWDTKADAKELMRIVEQETGGVGAADLQQRTGWSLRRLNPALRIVLRSIAPSRISGENQADYAASFFIPDEAERARFRSLCSS